MTPQGERDDVGETPGQERIRRTGLLFELHEGGTFVNEQEILCFADIQAEEVKWLWYPYIPYGKITILQGDPGCGKTMAVLSLAALLSKGESLPFEEAVREPINILYQTSEDGIADTIKPRLESAGANCTRIKIINEEKRALTFDDPRLEQRMFGVQSLQIQGGMYGGGIAALGAGVQDKNLHGCSSPSVSRRLYQPISNSAAAMP